MAESLTETGVKFEFIGTNQQQSNVYRRESPPAF
jgi:hypothetical protein